MARKEDTTIFNAIKHEETVTRMEERARSKGSTFTETAHDEGKRYYKETGKLHQNVNIFGAKRLSHNAMVVMDEGEKKIYVLVRGIKLPIIIGTDGTGSMGEKVALALKAMGKIYCMLSELNDRYQIDLSVAVLQDVQDTHPPFQMAEFESDNRVVEHIQLLIPDRDGGDSTEDYQLGLWYIDNQTDVDIISYGLKGYCFIVADADCREYITKKAVERYLGHTMQGEKISLRKICESLISKWHLFYLNVDNDQSNAQWWQQQMGQSRVISVPDPDLLAEVQAGLIYITETLQPTEDGLNKFLLAGSSNNRISQYDINHVWDWLQAAKPLFGAQAKLPGYSQIPKPGDKFANLRDIWPIGYNSATAVEQPTGASAGGINWDNF